MPGSAPFVKTESEALAAYLRQQRNGLKYAAYGLTDEQARLKPTASALSVAGLIKHGTATERMWVATMLSRPETADQKAYVDTFTPAPAETVDRLVAELEKAGKETEVAIAGMGDLDQRVQLPSAPWYPRDPEGFSARWILFHILEELARHAGHADIIREHIDGATMYELMAGAEGWPEKEWLKPWLPRSAADAKAG